MAAVSFRNVSTLGNVSGATTPRNLGQVDAVRTYGEVEDGHAVVFADASGRRIKDGGVMLTSESFSDLSSETPGTIKGIKEKLDSVVQKLKGIAPLILVALCGLCYAGTLEDLPLGTTVVTAPGETTAHAIISAAAVSGIVETATSGMITEETDPIARTVATNALAQAQAASVTASNALDILYGLATNGSVWASTILGNPTNCWLEIVEELPYIHRKTATADIVVVSVANGEMYFQTYNGPPVGTVWTSTGVDTWAATNGWILTRQAGDVWWIQGESMPPVSYMSPEGSEPPATLAGMDFGNGSLDIDWVYVTEASRLLEAPDIAPFATTNWVNLMLSPMVKRDEFSATNSALSLMIESKPSYQSVTDSVSSVSASLISSHDTSPTSHVDRFNAKANVEAVVTGDVGTAYAGSRYFWSSGTNVTLRVSMTGGQVINYASLRNTATNSITAIAESSGWTWTGGAMTNTIPAGKMMTFGWSCNPSTGMTNAFATGASVN